MRQSSLARTRGGKRPASFARSMSHSGCAYDPTSIVGRSMNSSLGDRSERPIAPILGRSPLPDKANALERAIGVAHAVSMRRRELRNKSRYYMVSLRRNWEDWVVNKIALVSLACLALGACSTPTQTVGTLGGVATGAAIGGPVGAGGGGAGGAVGARPRSALGGGPPHPPRYPARSAPLRHRC